MFKYNKSLKNIKLELFNINKLENIIKMFCGFENLERLDISKFDYHK